MQPCDACRRQLRLGVAAPPHPQLSETYQEDFGMGFWRWSETLFVCSACGITILHTTSKTHRGPTWMASVNWEQLQGEPGSHVGSHA
jgi:hypothetical protein